MQVVNVILMAILTSMNGYFENQINRCGIALLCVQFVSCKFLTHVRAKLKVSGTSRILK